MIESPKTLEDYLGNCIDAWHKQFPDLTVQEILAALETLRHKLTEGLIEADDQALRNKS